MNAFDLGPLAQESPPDVAQRMAERRELMRQACARTIIMAQRGPAAVDHEHLAWCKQFVAANPPLGRALSSGDPREQCVRCGQTGHLSKDCPWPAQARAQAHLGEVA